MWGGSQTTKHEFGIIDGETEPSGTDAPCQALNAPVFIKYRKNLNSDYESLTSMPPRQNERPQAPVWKEGQKLVETR